jgi:hypothetical protein
MAGCSFFGLHWFRLKLHSRNYGKQRGVEVRKLGRGVG